jgi:RNA ligase
MFPVIKHINDLQEKVGHQSEIRFNTNEFGFTIACYVVNTGETFTGENAMWARECRGITFDPNGNIASRPLHKFFNIGELPETQFANLADMQIKRVMDKRDGSMVHPVRANGKIMLKTKKSFTSDVALLATQELNLPKNYQILKFCEECIDYHVTPIFEFTSPKAQIVLLYPDSELKLLHIRDNLTGVYVENPKAWAKEVFGRDIPVVDEISVEEFNFEFLKKSLAEDQDIEGYVIGFENGMMAKGKTEWYLQLHHTITFVRERDIAEMILDETVDDYKSFLSLGGKSHDVVNEIEHRVLEEIRKIEKQIDEAYDVIKNCETRKEAALTLKGHEWFSAAMDRFNGKEFNVKEYFKKRILREKFSLEQV